MKAVSDDHIVATVRDLLPEVRAITLFGSRVDGSARPDSDLDLAVLLPSRADPVELWYIGEEIARRFDVDVDLVDLIGASTVLQHQIVTKGRRLFAADGSVDVYETFILAEMTALDEARVRAKMRR